MFPLLDRRTLYSQKADNSFIINLLFSHDTDKYYKIVGMRKMFFITGKKEERRNGNAVFLLSLEVSKVKGEMGISANICCCADSCVASLGNETPPWCCLDSGESPLLRGKKGSEGRLDGSFAKTRFEQFVGE